MVYNAPKLLQGALHLPLSNRKNQEDEIKNWMAINSGDFDWNRLTIALNVNI